MKDNGLDDKIQGLIVTKLEDNVSEEYPVESLASKNINNTCLIMVAVSMKNTYEAINELEKRGLNKIYALDSTDRQILKDFYD